MTINTSDVVRVQARMHDSKDKDVINTWFFIHAGVSSVSDADFLTDMEAELSNVYNIGSAAFQQGTAPVDITADVVVWLGGRLVTTHHVGAIAWTTWGGGSAATEELPQGCCALVSFSTQTPKVWGRKYFGTLPEGGQNAGVLNSTCLTALAALAADVLTGIVIDGMPFDVGVMSRKLQAFAPAFEAIVSSVIAYQRRRKSTRGS